MTAIELRRQAAALDRATERLMKAIDAGRETTSAIERAERELRAADRLIASARRVLRR